MASLAGIVRALEDRAIVLLETRDSDERPAEAAARLLALALDYRRAKDNARMQRGVRGDVPEWAADANEDEDDRDEPHPSTGEGDTADLQPVESVDTPAPGESQEAFHSRMQAELDRAREEPAPKPRPTRRQKADADAAGIAAQAAAEVAGAPPDAATILGHLRTHPIKEARI